jgi:hypothetical protein
MQVLSSVREAPFYGAGGSGPTIACHPPLERFGSRKYILVGRGSLFNVQQDTTNLLGLHGCLREQGQPLVDRDTTVLPYSCQYG